MSKRSARSPDPRSASLSSSSAAASAEAKATGQDKTPVNVDISDPIAIKAALDEHVGAFFAVTKRYKEDHTISNLKLALGLLSVALAVYAQFGDLPFPETRWKLGAIVAIYVVIQVVLNAIQTHMEGNLIFKSAGSKVGCAEQESGCGLAPRTCLFVWSPSTSRLPLSLV